MEAVELSSVYWHEFENMDDAISARNAAIDLVTNAEIQQQRCSNDINEAEAVEINLIITRIILLTFTGLDSTAI